MRGTRTPRWWATRASGYLRNAARRRRRTFDYALLAEQLAAHVRNDADLVGGGDFDHFGRAELAALQEAGLKQSDRLVDFGCGTGRLALHVIPYLSGGGYVGIDISRRALVRARQNVERTHDTPPCSITWVHSTSRTFPLPAASADMICAFSVFTHMEHEDAYTYLADALRVVRPRGRFVFSCLPLDLDVAETIFREAAELSLTERWGAVRNVTTSRDMMDAISTLAGWHVHAWYSGDDPAFDGAALGQSVCVLERQ